MSLFVLDTSVAIQWALPENGSVEALALQDTVHIAVREYVGILTSSEILQSSIETVNV
ncbi:MAG: hypothetical protein JWP89_592 [Schlesneria sp.]|nr:hypothetical protein [Schlesneria sp.]